MDTPVVATKADRPVAGVLVLVEDDAGVRRAVTLMLQQDLGRWRIETFAAARPAIAFFERETATLLLSDLGLPDMHGLEMIRQLRSRDRIKHVIVMTGAPTDDLPRELWDLGVSGFIDKTSLHVHLHAAIERVLAGGMYFSAQVTPARLREQPSAKYEFTTSVDRLSARERDVARLVAAGLLSKEIAAQLHLSPRTVEKHRANLMRKVGVRSVPQLVYWCLRQGLV